MVKSAGGSVDHKHGASCNNVELGIYVNSCHSFAWSVCMAIGDCMEQEQGKTAELGNFAERGAR